MISAILKAKTHITGVLFDGLQKIAMENLNLGDGKS